MTPKYIFPTYESTHLDIIFSFTFRKIFISLLPPLTMEIGLKSNTSVLR